MGPLIGSTPLSRENAQDEETAGKTQLVRMVALLGLPQERPLGSTRSRNFQ